MKAKILVVDDNQDVVYCVIDSLGLIEPGFEMIGLNSGKECLEQIEHIMPEIDGFETVSRIKQMDKVKNIPVIFLTGKIDNIGKNLGLLIAEDYINKPYDTADLKDRIIKALESRGAQITLLYRRPSPSSAWRGTITEQVMSVAPL